jgi:hypothetical protein
MKEAEQIGLMNFVVQSNGHKGMDLRTWTTLWINKGVREIIA